MADLADDGNVYNYALQILHDKGYFLSAELIEPGGLDAPDQRLIWIAKKADASGNIELAARDSPIALLGLAAIWDRWGDRWREADVHDWWGEVCAKD